MRQVLFLASLFLIAPVNAYNGVTVLQPDYFDRLESSPNLGNATQGSYSCQRFSGPNHKVMTTVAFKKIQKSCGGELSVRHIQPRKRFVPMNQWKNHETGYLLVCCKGKSTPRKRSFQAE